MLRNRLQCPTLPIIPTPPIIQDSRVYISTNISISKGNQAMKFGRFIEYNSRNIFLEKSHKCEHISITITQNWAYLWINVLKIYIFCFNCLPSWVLSKMIDTKLQTICFYLTKLVKKTKSGLELISLPHFLHYFWRNIFLLLYSITSPNFNVWLPLLREILGNMIISIFC